jgi:creatinine amidohydrolase
MSVQFSDEVQIERLTWAEIAEAVATGRDTVVCVVGSIEQHGPHLPCETDCYYGLAMALRVARADGGMLVAPVIRPGCSQHHEGFPGTFSIGPELLVNNVLEALRSLIAAGFKRIVLTSSHGGNFVPLAEAVDRFDELCSASGVRLTPVLDLFAWIDALKEAPHAHGLRQEDMPAIQADLIETSIMLALHPEMVRTDRIERGFIGDFDLDASFATEGIKALSKNGILGDPTIATAELGLEILDSIERYLADAIAAAAVTQS